MPHHQQERSIMEKNGKRETLDQLLTRYRRKLAEQGLGGEEEQALSESGYRSEILYTPESLPDFDYVGELGVPGEFPYTRGVYPSMYRGRKWTFRQYAGFGTAEESNRRYRYLLEQGQTGLSIAFDLPTQMGYDSDHAMAEGEVGKVGVAIDTLADMERLLDGIPLNKVSTSMTINATGFILLALYQAVAEKQGVAPEQLTGTIQNDILKEYIARGTYIFPPRPSLKIITDVFAYATDTLPRFNTISISGYHIREAGSTAAQEIAFTLTNGLTYVEAAIDSGLDVNRFGERLSFFFNAHSDLLEEVAKFRAARRLWAKLMRERFGATNPKACMLRFHTQTAGSTLTAQQPDVNVVRTALQALSAVLGGTQSLHTNARDEALGLPTQEAATLALRTQQVIAFESGVTETIDPLAGSYAVESMTDALEARSLEIMSDIESMGGMVAAIEKGWVQQEIHNAAYRKQRALEENERIVVGINKFREENNPPIKILRVDPELERSQILKLNGVRADRDGALVKQRLSDIEKAARNGSNLMKPTLEAVKAYASIGEITGALKKIFGTYMSE
jgi:methylmalonyl-CoA mutase, N-terminal domain